VNHASIYLGPFAEWQVKIVDVQIDRCRQPSNCPDQKSGYCQICGLNTNDRFGTSSRNDPLVFSYKLIKDNLSIVRDYECRLEIYLPNLTNRRCPTQRETNPEEILATTQDVIPNLIDAELAWFQQAYKDELDKLTIAYGYPPVIRWGVVRYDL
jgi:hypothetical protein